MLNRNDIETHIQNGTLAHLSIDLQRYYCLNHQDCERAVTNTQKLCDTLRNHHPDILQIWAYDPRAVYPDNLGDVTPSAARSSFCIDTKDEPIVRKFSRNAFAMMGLENTLKRKNIQCLLISGVMTDQCVLETAYRAKELGFNPVCIAECVAGRKPHAEGLALLQRVGIQVMNLKSVLSVLIPEKPKPVARPNFRNPVPALV